MIGVLEHFLHGYSELYAEWWAKQTPACPPIMAAMGVTVDTVLDMIELMTDGEDLADDDDDDDRLGVWGDDEEDVYGPDGEVVYSPWFERQKIDRVCEACGRGFRGMPDHGFCDPCADVRERGGEF